MDLAPPTWAMTESRAPRRAEPAPTIYDVAAAAGVATSTVSRAFARPGRVSAETAARIHAVAAELGYRNRTPAAGGVPTRRTGTIALAVPDLSNPALVGIIRGVQSVAVAAGFTVTVLDCRESAALERDSVHQLLPFADGVILAGSRMANRDIRKAAEQRPLIMVDRIVHDLPGIAPDLTTGITSALRHLHQLGHVSVAYVAGPAASWADSTRWRTIRDSGSELGLKISRIGPQPPTIAGGVIAADTLRRHPATAVVTFNDLIAIGLIRRLSDIGRHIPGHLSVIGFDNVFDAGFYKPALTTVAVPFREMGATAMLELCRILTGTTPMGYPSTPLTTRLIVRNTTGRTTN